MTFLNDFLARRFWANLFGLKRSERDIFFALSYSTVNRRKRYKKSVRKTPKTIKSTPAVKEEDPKEEEPDVIIRCTEDNHTKAILKAHELVFEPHKNRRTVRIITYYPKETDN